MICEFLIGLKSLFPRNVYLNCWQIFRSFVNWLEEKYLIWKPKDKDLCILVLLDMGRSVNFSLTRNPYSSEMCIELLADFSFVG